MFLPAARGVLLGLRPSTNAMSPDGIDLDAIDPQLIVGPMVSLYVPLMLTEGAFSILVTRHRRRLLNNLPPFGIFNTDHRNCLECMVVRHDANA